MISALLWLSGMIAFSLIGGWMHVHGIGPLWLLARGLDVLRACGYMAERLWDAMEWEFRTQWGACVAKAQRER